jgi:hypothetical protein
MIEKKPFINYDFSDEEEETDFSKEKKKKTEVISIKMNENDIAELKQTMLTLQQPKQSTAIKQMLKIARWVLLNSESGYIARLLFDNIRRNARIGINDVETELKAKVIQNE